MPTGLIVLHWVFVPGVFVPSVVVKFRMKGKAIMEIDYSHISKSTLISKGIVRALVPPSHFDLHMYDL